MIRCGAATSERATENRRDSSQWTQAAGMARHPSFCSNARCIRIAAAASRRVACPMPHAASCLATSLAVLAPPWQQPAKTKIGAERGGGVAAGVAEAERRWAHHLTAAQQQRSTPVLGVVGPVLLTASKSSDLFGSYFLRWALQNQYDNKVPPGISGRRMEGMSRLQVLATSAADFPLDWASSHETSAQKTVASQRVSRPTIEFRRACT